MTHDQIEQYGFYLQLAGLLLGPLLALIPVLVWELKIKPRRDRDHLLRTLYREIGYNSTMLELLVQADPGHPIVVLPTRVRLSTTAFDALASRVAEVPGTIAGDIIFLYNEYHRLNALADDLENSMKGHEVEADSDDSRKRHGARLAMIADALKDQLNLCRQKSEEVLRELKTVLPGESDSLVGAK